MTYCIKRRRDLSGFAGPHQHLLVILPKLELQVGLGALLEALILDLKQIIVVLMKLVTNKLLTILNMPTARILQLVASSLDLIMPTHGLYRPWLERL